MGLLQFIVPTVKLNFCRLTIFSHFDMQIFDSKIVFRKNHVFCHYLFGNYELQ